MVGYLLRIGIFLSVVIATTFLYVSVSKLGIRNLEVKRIVQKEIAKEEKKEPKEEKTERKPEEIQIRVINPMYLTVKRANQIVDVSDCNAVLPIIYDKAVNFKGISVPLKKKKFISYMLPQVLIVNFEIEEQRKVVEKIRDKLAKGSPLTKAEEKYLNKLMAYYRVKSINTLIKRMHVNPPSLVLAQAIAESGWGTSRFYLEGANAFGITAIRGKGNTIKMYGQNIYMRKYSKVIDSIRDYYYSINVSWAFEKLRKVRLSTDDPIEISHHLGYYSTLRDIYIRRIQYIIKQNRLRRLDKCQINPIYIQEMPLSKYMENKF